MHRGNPLLAALPCGEDGRVRAVADHEPEFARLAHALDLLRLGDLDEERGRHLAPRAPGEAVAEARTSKNEAGPAPPDPPFAVSAVPGLSPSQAAAATS
jgi:hypothetical protein